MLKSNVNFFVVLLMPILGACNHLFYHPAEQIFNTPARFELHYEEKWITTTDGHQLNAWIIAPTEPSVGTVLHFHGNAENMSTHFAFVAWMTTYGYKVITFDYRGYGKSKGTPNQRGLYTDALAALSFAAKQGGDLFVVAQSLGAAVAVPAIADSPPPNLRAVVLDSGFGSYREIARAKLGQFFLTWPLQYPLSWLVTDEVSPLDKGEAFRAPTLVIHGTADTIVPYQQGQRLYDLLGTEDKTMIRFESGQHTAALGNPAAGLYPRILRFLCEHASSGRPCAG